jgi:hypothetical protein
MNGETNEVNGNETMIDYQNTGLILENDFFTALLRLSASNFLLFVL